MSGPGIAEKVMASQAGDRASFEALILAYERQIVAHFMGQCHSLDVAEELAQDTFVRAYMSLSKLKDPARFGPWLYGIARNAYREWARDRKQQSVVPEPEPAERTEIIRRKALFHRQIYNIVYELPTPYKEVVSLRYFSGNSCREIASLLDRSLGTVTKQISRGHALVAQHLKGLQGFTTLLHFMLPKEGSNGD